MPYLRVGRARAAGFVAALSLALFVQGNHVAELAVASAQPSNTASQCIVLPNLPLSVGFADGTTTKRVQAQDAAIREVLRDVKSWLCGPAMTSPFLFADSLHGAIEQHQTLIVDQIRFDTQAPKHANVLLTDSRLATDRKHTWQVQVDHVLDSWKVSHAADAPSSLFIE